MSGGDTSLGGSGVGFPRTTWGLVSGLDPGAEGHRVAIELLCRRYWKPVYRYVRVAWAKSNEDAKDLTQAFMAWLLEKENLRTYEGERGAFRTFLKTLLRRFVSNQERALSQLKRGGGARILPLDDPDLPTIDPADPASSDPDAEFDRAWVADVVARAMARVREERGKRGDAAALEVYEAYDPLPPAERPTYRELAQRFDVPEHRIQTLLVSVREEIRRSILAELADTTGHRQGLEEEWNALFNS